MRSSRSSGINPGSRLPATSGISSNGCANGSAAPSGPSVRAAPCCSRPRLLHEFPDARVIHVFRDGRETAISMSRHYLFRLIAATMLALRSFGFDAMTSLARGKHWERLSFRLEPLTRVLCTPERLPWDSLTLPHFGMLWSAMIERGNRMLGHLPTGRLLNVRFEDVQAVPDAQIRRLIRFIGSDLEDEAWLREVSAIPRPTPSKFEKLGAVDRAALAEACRPGLERLGYPL